MDDEVKNGADDRVKLLTPKPFIRGAEARGETGAAWPSLTDEYKAAGNPDNEAITRLVVVMGHDRFKAGKEPAYYTLQYHDMGTGEYGFEANGQWFRIPFHEAGGTRLLEARGRGILRFGDYISLCRLPWIRVADRDFRPGDGADADTPIFTHLTVELIKEEEEYPPPRSG
jgi:hypothetical protein